MKVALIIFSTWIISSNVIAQTEEQARTALAEVSSLEALESLREEHPDWTIFSRTIMSIGTSYDAAIYHTKTGDVVATQTNNQSPVVLHKVITEGTEDACKVQYIYLDGKRRSAGEMKALRSQIIAAYKNGTPFLNLVHKFSEDGNPTGTLDWFYEGMTDPDFDKAVRSKPAGSIFTVDVPQRYWYYVVLKTDENKELPTKYTISIRINE